ncbi:GMC oxidoreductase [Glonium stellatum]|uniref:GMC oxidoreductase n=1 Tax=Glonium stellatum TaxID=574774 RepID=A0A8E2FAI9_9PEZI|nr:GMC oxidoreductase [Glonium stellatum]
MQGSITLYAAASGSGVYQLNEDFEYLLVSVETQLDPLNYWISLRMANGDPVRHRRSVIAKAFDKNASRAGTDRTQPMANCSALKAFSRYLLGTIQSTSTYDYVVIGGGTAGLTIAARLTEDPDVSAIVLEAGNDHSSDINVLSPGLYTSMYGDSEYDWNYKTVPQTHASQRDIDNWGSLGNANWSWDALQPYYKKSEDYVAPSKKTQKGLQTEYVVPGMHGMKGPIVNTFPSIYGLLDEAWPHTYEKLGLAVQSDPRQGGA